MVNDFFIKSIIINNKEIIVEQMVDIENKGINILATTELIKELNIKGDLIKQNSLDYIKVKTKSNAIYTLFNCFVWLNTLFISIVYHELIKADVNSNNFMCEKLIVELEFFYPDIFSENICYMNENIKIEHNISDNDYNVIIYSKTQKNSEFLFKTFICFFQYLNLLIGYFPKIKKRYYYNNNEIIETQNELSIIYSLSCNKFNERFFSSIDNTTFNNSFGNYIKFYKKAYFQMQMLFYVLIEKNTFLDMDFTNLLQAFDGLYNNLSLFDDNRYLFPKKMNKEIIKRINEIDFTNILNKYSNNYDSSFDLKNLLGDYLCKMYEKKYREKLSDLVSFDNYIVFKKEKDAQLDFIEINSLIKKCTNTRNQFSHVSRKEEIMEPQEIIEYKYKFILLFKLLIYQEIGLYDKVIKASLKNSIENCDKFIIEHSNNKTN